MPVPLISPSARLRVQVRPSVMAYDPVGGARVAEPGIKLRFDNGTCTCPDDVWPLLEKHGAYTGVGQQKLVWRADEGDRPEAGKTSLERVQIHQGQQVNRPRHVQEEPISDWNNSSVRVIVKRIEDGEVENLSKAIAYENAHKARRGVLKALALAVGGDDGDAVADEVAGGDVPDTFSAGAQ